MYNRSGWMGSPRSILIVEDDETIRETIAELLQGEGFRVLTAGDGKRGLELLHACQDAALVLLDLWMPVMNGWEFLEAKLADPQLSLVPVVVISAVGAHTPMPEGARAFLHKPIRLNTLLAAVEMHRRRA
jgi:CheY-like chemotaxis protein